MTEPVLELAGVGFDYGAVSVIDGLDLSVSRGELLMCVGPSGCGKTTLLALLGGHLAPTRGTIDRHSSSTRTIYQDGGLFPWLTVRENVASGLDPKIKDQGTRAQKVADWLALTQLTEFAQHYPHQLSGGMRQRVELGRALAGETDILLMDEPFSALDYQTRRKMRHELVSTLEARPRTVVFVTHDIEEAVQLGDRVLVLAPRPSKVRRSFELPPGRSRLPADPGVAEAEQAILEELGLT